MSVATEATLKTDVESGRHVVSVLPAAEHVRTTGMLANAPLIARQSFYGQVHGMAVPFALTTGMAALHSSTLCVAVGVIALFAGTLFYALEGYETARLTTSRKESLLSGFRISSSYATGALMPLLPYAIFPHDLSKALGTSLGVGAAMMALMGFVRQPIIAKVDTLADEYDDQRPHSYADVARHFGRRWPWRKSVVGAVQMVVFAAITAGGSYGIVHALRPEGGMV